MRAGGIVIGLLSLVGSSLAEPSIEVFESLYELPPGWAQVRTPAPETKVALRIALEHPNQELFEQTLLDVSTPDHPKYGQHLSSAELKYMLKPRAESTDSVMSWLDSAKVPAADIKNDGEWINFRATVAQAEELLSTKFYVYKHNEDNKEMIRTLEYSLPSSVASHVLTIQPTTRFSRVLAQRSAIHDVDTANAVFGIAATSNKAPAIPTTELDVKACNASITPACLRALYNIGDYQADPKGNSLFGVAGYLNQYAKEKDLATFLKKYAPYASGTNFTAVGIKGGQNLQNSTEGDVEANLDIQYAVALSYNIPVTYYSTAGLGELVPDLDQPDKASGQNEPYLDFIEYILALPKDKLPQTITTSYGENEQSVPPKYAKKVCSMFGELGLRGVSVLFSSGDTGVGSACQTNDGKNTTRFLPIFPAACPWVTSVGGTLYVEPEHAVSFSSGGFSDIFPRPKYQEAAVNKYLSILGDRWKGLYNPAGRGFPDVAAQGYHFHVIDELANKTNPDILVGGTSASAPAFAAIIALLNNARTSRHLPPLGFLNPWIYAIGHLGLNDVTHGGSTGCTGTDVYSKLPTPVVPFASWNATVGWDPVTGLGTPDFERLLGLSKTYDQDDSWLLLERRYTSANLELIETLARVEKLALINSSVKAYDQSISEVNELGQKLRCIMLPPTKSSRFFNRADIFEKIDQAFDLATTCTSFRSIALWGLGGIGKSAIAAKYVERKVEENEYDAVFWVYGEKTASLRQSFTDIAMRLKLPGAQLQNHAENLILVQDWFQSSDCRWLVIYNDVESSDLLMPYWPQATTHGKAIITTRNRSIAFDLSITEIEIPSWDIQTGTTFLLSLLKNNIINDIEAEKKSAYELSELLSGHALGILHMAGLIHGNSWSIAEFMRIYLENPKDAHKSKLEAIWDFSFKTLKPDSAIFLGIVSFLMADNIPQSLFEFDSKSDLPEDLEFCSNGFGFSNVVEPLLTFALIKRNRVTRVFSTHRMVQKQFRYFLSPEQQQKAFDNAVALVYHAFPKQDDQKAQLYEQWVQCNYYLQHVLNLKDCFKEMRKLSKDFKASWKFCELLKECQRYAYEANALRDLEDLCEVNLIAVNTLDNEDQTADLIASILSHQANMYECIGKAEKAIELNKRGYEMRLREVPLKHGLLAGFESNLGYNYNTANDHKTALLWFEKARDRWLAWTASQGKKPGWPIHMKKNMARCLVYLHDLAGARDLLHISIAEFKNSELLNWAMLAYAYFVLGILERREGRSELAEANFMEAQNLWRKGDQTRLHPFNGGCLYKIGVVCLDQGKVEAAAKHLRDSIEVTKFHKTIMPVEHARSLFKLSEALLRNNYGSEDEAKELRGEAETYLKKRNPDAVAFGTEEAYDIHVPIFWR
ncbi:hypothetical protein VE03_09669 [Pseudogymnoascus sp. 23342-1-I1]|nr:hypothetical protein VE03_09669 [Pseudogymnoascus sp. 23342-1-I1]